MSALPPISAQARVDNSTKEQRQEWARTAARARWQKPNHELTRGAQPARRVERDDLSAYFQ